MELFEQYIKTDGITFKHAKGKSVISGKEFHIYNEIIYFIDGKAELITEYSRTVIKPYTLCVMFITQYRKTIDFHTTNSLIMYAKGDSKERILPAVAFCVRNTNTGTILLF